MDQYASLSALPEAERFELLPQAALASQRAARRAAQRDDQNMDRYVRVKADNARRFALDALALAERFRNHPDVGTAIYTANMTLASLAVLDGDTDAATEYLRHASLAPPAEGLAYGQRVTAWVVVRDLVNAGQRDAVVEFLEAMADKTVVDRDRVLATAEDVRNGQSPTAPLRGVPGGFPIGPVVRNRAMRLTLGESAAAHSGYVYTTAASSRTYLTVFPRSVRTKARRRHRLWSPIGWDRSTQPRTRPTGRHLRLPQRTRTVDILSQVSWMYRPWCCPRSLAASVGLTQLDLQHVVCVPVASLGILAPGTQAR